MSTNSGDRPVVVVGAGVVGLATAFFLSESGAHVVVVERATIGSGASWGNAGWVCRSLSVPVPAPGVVGHVASTIGRPGSPLYLRPEPSLGFARWMWQFLRSTSKSQFAASASALTRFAAPIFDQFAELEAAGVDTTLTRPGLLHAFLSAHEAERTLSMQRRFAADLIPVPSHVSDGDELRRCDPSLSTDVVAGYLVEGEGLVNPEGLTNALAKALGERGVQVLEHTAVTGFRSNGGAVNAVRLADREIACSDVIVTAGTWSAALAAELGTLLPLQAGKGYSFSVTLPVPPSHPMYFGDKHIVASPIAGHTRIAGTMELSGNNLRLDWRRIVSIAKASRSYLGDWFAEPDELMGCIAHPWVGGRPMLPDGLPVIDRLPGLRNAYVSTGHGMLGVALSTASGKALSRLVLEGRRPRELEAFQVARIRGIRKIDGP